MAKSSAKTVKLTLVRSKNGRLKSHKACIAGLGIRRMHQTVEVIDTPEIPDTASPQKIEQPVMEQSSPMLSRPHQPLEPVLALPVYQYKEEKAEKVEMEKMEHGQMRSERVRRTKIRPITPHPVVYLERLD